ncbi:MAG: glucose-6-phosphate dehydrogenase [Phycisphaerales bacterium]
MPAPDPCILVIFGASGDLTGRKLIPALYDLSKTGGAHGQLPERFAVIGVSRTAMSDDEFRGKMRESARKHAASYDDASWNAFVPKVHYQVGDAAKIDCYPGLMKRIEDVDRTLRVAREGCAPNLLLYLSVAPQLYEPIIAAVGESGLVTEGKRWCSINPAETAWQRIIIEKPFGEDLHSARSLNRALGRVFEEEAIYRIDHYLGKELVQNILVLRFANSIFEPVWNRQHIDHIQLTAAETLGVGSRAGTFYDGAGALRDMIQSHLLQVMALVAIEPPSVFEAAPSMREKIKLFDSARVTAAARVARNGVFGRYGRGAGPEGRVEPAYTEEKGVDPARKTETYAAIRLEIDNWRWEGVPFYLRSGKKLSKKLTEVVVQFRRPPTNLFRRNGRGGGAGDGGGLPGNRLVINIAPREGLELSVLGKVPGQGLKFEEAHLSLDYLERFGGEQVDAYGPLLLDAMRGDRTLFKHRDEVEGGWRIVQPFLENRDLRDSIEEYAPGSWGPRGADELLARDGRAWHNP